MTQICLIKFKNNWEKFEKKKNAKMDEKFPKFKNDAKVLKKLPNYA